jgi:hypothetical protein
MFTRSRLLVLLLALGLLAAVPVVADAAKSGRYKGKLYAFGSFKKVDETGKVSFKVRRKTRLAKFKFVDTNYRCINDGADPSDDTFEYAAYELSTVRIRRNRVNQRFEAGDETIEFKARLKGKAAKGTIAVFGPRICTKEWSWKAKLRR